MNNLKNLAFQLICLLGFTSSLFAQLTPCPNNNNECNIVCYGDFENLPAGTNMNTYTGSAYIGGPNNNFPNGSIDYDGTSNHYAHLHSGSVNVNGTIENRFHPLTLPLMRNVCPGESGTFSFQIKGGFMQSPMKVGAYFANFSPAAILPNQDFINYSAPGKYKDFIGEVNCTTSATFTTYTINYTNNTSHSYNHLVFYINANIDSSNGTPCTRIDNIKYTVTSLNPDFSYSRPWCENNKINIQVSAGSCNPQGSMWQIYESDQNGVPTSTTAIATGWGQLHTFSIAPNATTTGYVMIKHGVWSPCTSWQEVRKTINVSQFSNPNPDFTISNIDLYSNGTAQAKFTCNAIEYHASSQYYVYGSNNPSGPFTNGPYIKSGHNVTFDSANGDMPYFRNYRVYRRITTCAGKSMQAVHTVYMGWESWHAPQTGTTRKQVPSVTDIEKISAVPNPSTGLFSINVTELELGARYSVLDINGKRLQEFQNKGISGTSFSIDLSNYAKGVYLLQIESNTTVHTVKLMKL